MALRAIKLTLTPVFLLRKRDVHFAVRMGRTIFYLEFKVNLHTTENGVHIMTVYVNNVPFEFRIAMDRSC